MTDKKPYVSVSHLKTYFDVTRGVFAPKQIVKAVRISRKCIGIVKQNIVFSLIVKFGCLALVAAGLANMWAAIFADVGVMILAVLNAIRALRYKE